MAGCVISPRPNFSVGTSFSTYHVLLLPRDLTWRLKVDSKNDMIRLFGLGDILDGGNVERYSVSINGEDDCLSLLIDIHLTIRLLPVFQF